MPFKQVPVLEVDGQSLSQSNAIARYLASKFKLNGQTDLETAVSNMYVDHIDDLRNGNGLTKSYLVDDNYQACTAFIDRYATIFLGESK